MKKILSLFCLLALFGLGACDNTPPEMSVGNAYSFATSAKQRNGAIFVNITNANGKMERLTGVEIPETIADHAELHTHIKLNGNMGMRTVDSMDAQNGLTMEPMGNHIMLMDLKKPLNIGSSFPITLIFENSGEIKTTVRVISPGTKP